jgi:protein Mpv17
MTKFQTSKSLFCSLLLLLAFCSSSKAFRRDDFSSRPTPRINVHRIHHSAYTNPAPPNGLPAANDSTLKQCYMSSRGGAGVGAVNDNEGSSSFLERHPFLFGISITTVKAVLADLLTQLVFEGKNNIPWNVKRTLFFGAFGLFYQGMVQYVIVNLFWERLFPGTKPRAVVTKICGMNLLSDPLLFMPTFYIFKQVMTEGGGGGVAATVKAALLAYKANCFMDWRNSWMVWFPGHAVTYGVLPIHKRIPWMAFLSFFYMCVLSYTRGGA